MEILIAILSIVVLITSVIGSIVGNIAASEIYNWCPAIARSIVNRAVAQLPNAAQERYREEWYAHLDECPTKLGKIWHSIGCYFSARAVSLSFVENEYDAVVRQLGLDALEPQVKEIFIALLPVLKKYYGRPAGSESAEILASEIDDVLDRYDEEDAETAVEAYEKIIDYVQKYKS
jgi:hypothetical protein